MDFYKDLSYYSRFHFENAVNIGFEKNAIANASSTLDMNFVEKLIRYLKYPLNSVRGGIEKRITINGIEYVLGFSEIRVISKNGQVFASPDEIIANIVEGTYLPPAIFIDAVTDGISPDSELYQIYLSKYSPQQCWGASNEYVMDVVNMVERISIGDLFSVRNLISNRPDLLDIVTGNGSLLNEAITRNQQEIAKYLIEAGINLNKFEGVELLTAVECGLSDIVKLLLNCNIAIKMDRPRNNPLFLAIGRHQNEIAEMLYGLRKDLVITYNTEFTANCNILQWTKKCNNPEFMEYLLKQV